MVSTGDANNRPVYSPVRKDIRKWILRGLLIVVLLAICVYSTPKVIYSLSHESTDDAYVDGSIVPIAAEVKGRVVKVYVEDNRMVNAGDPLFEIYSEDYFNSVKEKEEKRSALMARTVETAASIEERRKASDRARADLDAAVADEKLAQKDMKRDEQLLKKGAISQSLYDRVEAHRLTAKAHAEAASAALAEADAAVMALNARLRTQASEIKEAEASLSAAKLDLRRTLIVAPISGRIARKNVDPGKYVQAGQPLLAIVDENNTWITANFKETQIENMRVGQPVDIRADCYPGLTFKGRVDSFQPGTGAVFSLLPPQNAAGTFVKVVQRIPVKIVLNARPDPAHPLWAGLSILPNVDISVENGLKLKDANGRTIQ